MMEVRNATIDGTNLGVHHTDHGILSFYIHLNFGNMGQGFGGWVLDTNNPPRQDRDLDWDERQKMPVRLPTTLASSLLLGIHQLFGCDWEKLKGQSCRAYGNNDKLTALGHFLEDKWLWLQEGPDKDSPNGWEFVVTTLDAIKEEK